MQGRQTYTLEEMRAKAERDWIEDPDGKSSLNGGALGLDSKHEAGFGRVETPEVSALIPCFAGADMSGVGRRGCQSYD